MSDPTPIYSFEDILTAMEKDPGLQAAMRQHVLGQEFLQLPAIVRELQQTVALLAQTVNEFISATNLRLERLEEDVAELKTDVAVLKTDVKELKDGQARLQKDVNRLDGNMNRLIGSDYERKAARRASRLAQRHLGLRAMTLIYAITKPDDSTLAELLDNAVASGRISLDDAEAIENADIILSGPEGYAVAEVSVTLDAEDIRRARERADLLSRATATIVPATAICSSSLDEAVSAASQRSVTIMTLAD